MIDVVSNLGTWITALGTGCWLYAGSTRGTSCTDGIGSGPQRGAALGRVGTFFIGAFGDVNVDIFPKIGGRRGSDRISGTMTTVAGTLGRSIMCVPRLDSRNIVGIIYILWRVMMSHNEKVRNRTEKRTYMLDTYRKDSCAHCLCISQTDVRKKYR
jgi:hypothetical protein